MAITWDKIIEVPEGTVLTDETIDAFILAFEQQGTAKQRDTVYGTYPSENWTASNYSIPEGVSFGTKRIPGANPFYFVNKEDERGQIFPEFGIVEEHEPPEPDPDEPYRPPDPAAPAIWLSRIDDENNETSDYVLIDPETQWQGLDARLSSVSGEDHTGGDLSDRRWNLHIRNIDTRELPPIYQTEPSEVQWEVTNVFKIYFEDGVEYIQTSYEEPIPGYFSEVNTVYLGADMNTSDWGDYWLQYGDFLHLVIDQPEPAETDAPWGCESCLDVTWTGGGI